MPLVWTSSLKIQYIDSSNFIFFREVTKPTWAIYIQSLPNTRILSRVGTGENGTRSLESDIMLGLSSITSKGLLTKTETASRMFSSTPSLILHTNLLSHSANSEICNLKWDFLCDFCDLGIYSIFVVLSCHQVAQLGDVKGDSSFSKGTVKRLTNRAKPTVSDSFRLQLQVRTWQIFLTYWHERTNQ